MSMRPGCYHSPAQLPEKCDGRYEAETADLLVKMMALPNQHLETPPAPSHPPALVTGYAAV